MRPRRPLHIAGDSRMNDQLRIKNSTRSRSLTKQAIQRLHPIEQTEKIMRSSMKDHAQRLEDEQSLIREHHKELEALKRSIQMWQNNYLSLFSASPTGFLTVYADKTIKEANPALTAMLNLSSLDILGQSLMDFAADRQSVGIADYIDGVFAGSAGPLDIMLKRKDGTTFPAMLSSALIKEDDQANSFCLCALTDLSELKQNRDEKDNLQQQIKDELERTVTDQMRTIKLLNSRCDETAKLIQSRFDQSQTLKDSLNTQSQVNSELREKIISVENEIADRTDKLESTRNKLKDEVQKRRQLAIDLANIKDVAARTEQHTLAGSWQMDIGSKQFICSDQFYRIFGLKPQIAELSLTDLIDAVETDDRETVQAAIDNAISDKTQFDITHRIVKLDGTVTHVRTKGEFITQDDKPAIIGTIIDASEQALIKHDLDLECSRLNGLNEQLSSDLAQSNEKLESIKIDHNGSIEKLDCDLDKLQKTLDEKASELERLETECKVQTQQSEKLQAEYDELKEHLEAKVSAVEAALASEKTKLKQTADEKQQIETQKNDLQQTVTGQMETIEHLTSRCDEADKLAQNRLDELQTIGDDLQSISEQFESSKKQLTEQTAKVTAVKTALASEKTKLQQTADAKQQVETQKNDLQQTVTGQMETIDHLTGHCDEAAKLAQDRLGQLQTLKDGLNTQSQVNTQLREKITSVENEIADRTGKLESTGNKLKDEVQKRRQLAIDLASIKDVAARTEQHTLAGSWQMDIDSKQFVCSDQFYHIFGLKPQIAELSLADLIDAVETDDREMVRAAIENAISDQTKFDITHRIVQLDGAVIHVRTRGEFVTQDGKLAIIGTIIDTTEQTLIKYDLDTQCSRLNDLSEQLSNDLTQSNEKLENIKISHKDEIEKLNRDLDRLQKSLDEKASEILRLETDSKAQAQQSEKLQTEYDDLMGKLEAKTAEIQEIESVYEVQSEKYQKLESEFAWLSHEHETLIAEKSARMNDLVEQLQKQREKHSRYISRSQARTARLKKQLATVSDDFDSITKQLSEQREKADHAVTSLDACQNLLGHLSESIPFTLSIYDQSQCKTICVSDHLGRQLGYSHRQIERLGEDFYADLIHPDDVIRMADELDGFEWEGYDGVLESQFRIKAADDSWRHIKAVELVFDKQQKGGPVEILTAHIDITQQKHTEQTIRDLHELLAEKHAQLNDIFNCVSAARNS